MAIRDGTQATTNLVEYSVSELAFALKRTVEGEYGHDGVFRTDRVMIKHSNEYRAPEPGEAPSQMFSTLVEGDE